MGGVWQHSENATQLFIWKKSLFSEYSLTLNFIPFIYFLSTVHIHTCVCWQVETRGQLLGFSSFLLPQSSHGSHSGHQAWWQVTLLVEHLVGHTDSSVIKCLKPPAFLKRYSLSYVLFAFSKQNWTYVKKWECPILGQRYGKLWRWSMETG